MEGQKMKATIFLPPRSMGDSTHVHSKQYIQRNFPNKLLTVKRLGPKTKAP